MPSVVENKDSHNAEDVIEIEDSSDSASDTSDFNLGRPTISGNTHQGPPGQPQARPRGIPDCFKRVFDQWWDGMREQHNVHSITWATIPLRNTGSLGQEWLYGIYTDDESQERAYLGHVRYHIPPSATEQDRGSIELVVRGTPVAVSVLEAEEDAEDPASSPSALPAATEVNQDGQAVPIELPRSYFAEATRPLCEDDKRVVLNETPGMVDDSGNVGSRTGGITKQVFAEFKLLSLLFWSMTPELRFQTSFGDMFFHWPLAGRVWLDGTAPATSAQSLGSGRASRLRYGYNLPTKRFDPHASQRLAQQATIVKIWKEACRREPQEFIPKLYHLLNDPQAADAQAATTELDQSFVAKISVYHRSSNLPHTVYYTAAHRKAVPWKLCALRAIGLPVRELSEVLWRLLSEPNRLIPTFEVAYRGNMTSFSFPRELTRLVRILLTAHPSTERYFLDPAAAPRGSPHVTYSDPGILQVRGRWHLPWTARPLLKQIDPDASALLPDAPGHAVDGMSWADCEVLGQSTLYLYSIIFDSPWTRAGPSQNQRAKSEDGNETDDDQELDEAAGLPPARPEWEKLLGVCRPYVARYVKLMSSFSLDNRDSCLRKGELTIRCDWSVGDCDPDDMIEYQVHNYEECVHLLYVSTVADAVQNSDFSCLDPVADVDFFEAPEYPSPGQQAHRTRHGCARAFYPARSRAAPFRALPADRMFFALAINHSEPSLPVLLSSDLVRPRHCDAAAGAVASGGGRRDTEQYVPWQPSRVSCVEDSSSSSDESSDDSEEDDDGDDDDEGDEDENVDDVLEDSTDDDDDDDMAEDTDE